MLSLPHLPPISFQTKSSSMESEPFSIFQFPPGFRFHPSDEELITHYLLNKVNSHPLPACVIAEIELYNYNPWELPKKALFGEEEWFFFSPRDRKYPNGERPNRAAGSGYWKATGTDKPILSAGSKKIGVKKALVFYAGRPPRGVKTDWIMNEYRLPDTSRSSKFQGSMRLDNWVLCRVRQKGNLSKNSWEVPQELTGYFPKIEEVPSAHAYPNTNFTSGVLLQDSPDKELMGYFTKIDQELPSAHAYSNTNIITAYGSRGCQALATALTGRTLPHTQNSNGGNNGTSLYEDGSDNGSLILEDSFFQTICNATKRKNNEGMGYENLLPSAKMATNNKENEDISPGNRLNTNNSNFYIQNQYKRDTFNPSPLNAILTFQGLNECSFTGRFLMEQALTEGHDF